MYTLAIQIDSRGVTAVLCELSKAGDARLHGVATVDRKDSAEALAEVLRNALPKLRGAKPSVAVAIGPDQARVRTLPVPPAPDDELPALVALQAAREAASAPDDLVADFLPAAGESDGPQSLLVAWASNDCIEYWQAVAENLGGRLAVATPRPLAATPVAVGPGSRVYATRAGDSVDFAAYEDGRPVLVRSAHIGVGDASRELKRTLLGLTGDGSEPPTVTPLNSGLLPSDNEHSTPVWPILDSVAEDQRAEYQACLAAVGLAVHTGMPDDAALDINLADPRKPAVKETGRRRQALLAGATAAVLLAGGWMAYERLASLDREAEELRKQIAVARDEVEAFEPYRDRVAALDTWRESDVTWLDELERLGRKLRPKTFDNEDYPVASDIRASQIVGTSYIASDQPGGRIDLTAVARSSSTSALESRLRDESHPVEPISTSESPGAGPYRYKYSALLRTPAGSKASEGEDSP